jgi:acetoin utilization protein AcuB
MPAEKLTVQDLMSPKVVTIGMDDTLKVARRTFSQRRFHHLVVMEKGKAVGVVSDRDLLRHTSPFIGNPMSERPQDAATLRKRVHQIMTRRLICIAPDASPVEAAQLMMKEKVSCLPVINEDERLVGIITTRDLIHWAARCHVDAPVPV